jgi:hypothetical protein
MDESEKKTTGEIKESHKSLRYAETLELLNKGPLIIGLENRIVSNHS